MMKFRVSTLKNIQSVYMDTENKQKQIKQHYSIEQVFL